ADPNYAAMYAPRSRRGKTDRRDARTLADACRLGAYPPAHRASAAQREVRAELAVREALVRTRTRYLSVIRALLRRQGIRVPSGRGAAGGAGGSPPGGPFAHAGERGRRGGRRGEGAARGRRSGCAPAGHDAR